MEAKRSYNSTDRRRTARPLRRLRDEAGIVSLVELVATIPLLAATMAAVLSLNVFSVNETDRITSRIAAGAGTGGKQQPADQRVAMAKITRDLRQATNFIAADGETVHFEAMLKPADGGPVRKRQVRYSCYANSTDPDLHGKCKREEGPAVEDGGSWDDSYLLVENVVNTDLFTIEPATKPSDGSFNDKPRYATVKLAVSIEHDLCPGDRTSCRTPNPSNPIVLQSGVELLATRYSQGDNTDACDFVPEPPECEGES